MSECKQFTFDYGYVQSWPTREQPVITTYYAELKHGPLDDEHKPYLSHSLNLTLDCAKSLVEALNRAMDAQHKSDPQGALDAARACIALYETMSQGECDHHLGASVMAVLAELGNHHARTTALLFGELGDLALELVPPFSRIVSSSVNTGDLLRVGAMAPEDVL